MSISVTDSRRLTGGNLFWDHPSAIIDLAIDPVMDESMDEPMHEFIQHWQRAAHQLLDATGHGQQKCTSRRFTGGASVLISAPIDALYSMCELNEAAVDMALSGQENVNEQTVTQLKALFAEEARPRILALQTEAEARGVPFLWDDDAVSIGHGATAQVWTPEKVPKVDEIDWSTCQAIPLALVTGTNGKSTTVRMAASILAEAGLRAGLTSTDWIRVGDNILDTGDYSGTGGARTLLRHPDTEVAVLETARGGLLRRGLGVGSASAALITNVAADHLGDYGINTVPELRQAKFIVRRALTSQAPLILNADDSGLVAFARQLDHTVQWFSLDPDNVLVQQPPHSGGRAAVLHEGWLELREGHAASRIIRAADIPATCGGAARHNISNALAALLLCKALGVADDALARGLQKFRGDTEDNPGRGNWFEAHGVRILVDFAHNEHGLKALTEMVSQLGATRYRVLLSQAGDRTDHDIRQMTRVACSLEPVRLLLCELPGYERGRDPGEVPRLIRATALECGVSEAAISLDESPLLAARRALSEAREGDLLILLALTQRAEVLAEVNAFINA